MSSTNFQEVLNNNSVEMKQGEYVEVKKFLIHFQVDFVPICSLWPSRIANKYIQLVQLKVLC